MVDIFSPADKTTLLAASLSRFRSDDGASSAYIAVEGQMVHVDIVLMGK